MAILKPEKTAIYLVCFHSEKPESLEGLCRPFLTVEAANRDGEWPYDNGDDPSFWVARRGGPLTWGVCRQDLRNAIRNGSMVAFFSFAPLSDGRILYRLCGVTTVAEKVDLRALHSEKRFARFRRSYSNALIKRYAQGWRYDESDRRPSQRHQDWLWRIADHQGMSQKEFNARYAAVYRKGWFSDAALANGRLKLATNYVVFSTGGREAYISHDPPEVAIAHKGQHERWTNRIVQSLTVATAAKYLKSRRDYLRVANSSGRNVHRQIRFEMPADQAIIWREELIAALRNAASRTQGHGAVHARAVGRGKC